MNMTPQTPHQRFIRAVANHGLHVIVILVILFLLGTSTYLFSMHRDMRESGHSTNEITRSIRETAWATLVAAGLTATIHIGRMVVHLRHGRSTKGKHSTAARRTTAASTGTTGAPSSASSQREPSHPKVPSSSAPGHETSPQALPRPSPSPMAVVAGPENPMNLRHVQLTTRIIGIGLIPNRETALRLARNHGYDMTFGELDEHAYVELPSIGVDIHTIRHQTQVRTTFLNQEPEAAFLKTATLIEHALETTMPAVTMPQDATLPGHTPENATDRNRHPFDDGMMAIIITLENTVDDHAPQEQAPYVTRESHILHSEFERDTSLHMTLSWQNLDRAMRNGDMAYTAEIIMRTRAAMPSGRYLTDIYQEVAQNTRARTLKPMHEHRKPVPD